MEHVALAESNVTIKFEVERKTVVVNLKTNEANSNSRKKPIGIIKRMIDI